MKIKAVLLVLVMAISLSTTVYAEPLYEKVGEIRSGIGDGGLDGVIAVAKYANISLNFTRNVVIDSQSGTNTSIEINTIGNISSGNVNITLFNENPTDKMFGAVAINKYVDIEVSQDIGDSLEWAIIKIYYRDEEVAGVIESLLRIYYFNGSDWEPYNPPQGGVDITENYVWANTTHFSVFGVYLTNPYCGDGICYGGEDCSLCPEDCGACQPPPARTEDNVGGGGGGGGGITPAKTCIENWSCSEWSECVNGKQIRTCTDISDCGTLVEKPSESQTCGVEETKENLNASEEIEPGYEGGTSPSEGLELPTGLIIGEYSSYIAAIIAVAAILVGVVYWKKIRNPGTQLPSWPK
jgi:hypothetical protein